MTPDQEAAYRALLAGERSSPARFVDAFVSPLYSLLRKRHLAIPSEIVRDAANDALIAIIRHPEGYRPGCGTLLNYLVHIAEHKLVDELRRAQRRRETPVGGAVELEFWESKNDPEQPQAEDPDQIPAPLQSLVDEALPDPKDRAIARLIAQGRTDSVEFAEALEIALLPAETRRAEIKRHRDRVLKRLQRRRELFRRYLDEP